MILQALTKYYNSLHDEGKAPDYGFAYEKPSYLISIDVFGKLINITTLKEDRMINKKTVKTAPQREVPMPVVRSSNVNPQFLYDKSAYFFGASQKSATKRDKKCFAESKSHHHKVLDGCDSPVAKAILSFFDNWEYDAEHEAILRCPEVIGEDFLIFDVMDYGIAHENESVRKAWEVYLMKESSQNHMTCLVTGEKAPIARIHMKAKGIRGTNPAGANLVSFKAPSTHSFGKQQGFIAPVSEQVNFAYNTAFNLLLKNDDSHCLIGTDTVVYWTEDLGNGTAQMLNFCLNPPNKREEKDRLIGHLERITKGFPVDNVNLKASCHIIALSGNEGRFSIRYHLRDSLGFFLQNISEHYQRLEITKADFEPDILTPQALLEETVNPNTRNKEPSPLLGGAVMRAILNNTPYPDALFKATLLRIRAVQDNRDKNIYKITRGRVAIVKACMLKMNLPQEDKEVLTIMLNQESNNKAYVLGRLFSVLENIQEQANPGINATIKDRFFNAAGTTPLTVFPNLMRLSNHHLNKISNEGAVVNLNKSLSDLLGRLDVENNPFPAHLDIREQGLFLLGYYHQTQYRFTKKEDK